MSGMSQPPVDPEHQPDSGDEPTRAPGSDWLSKSPTEQPLAPPSYYPQQGYPQQGPAYQQGPGYPPQPGYYLGFPPPPPDHPRSTTALVLGLIALAGGSVCALAILAGPFAWVIGAKARKEIDANPQMYGGRSQATAGMVLGIIATALLIIGLIGIAVLVAIGLSGGFDDGGSSTTYNALG